MDNIFNIIYNIINNKGTGQYKIGNADENTRWPNTLKNPCILQRSSTTFNLN